MRGLRRMRTPSPAMVVACLALIVALSGAAYAASNLPRNSVGTAQLKRGAVTSTKVLAEGLTLGDLGAAKKDGRQSLKSTVSTPIAVAADTCRNVEVGSTNPGPHVLSKILGALVIGTLTDATGHAAVDNAVAVAPSMVIETDQGGAIMNLVVCSDNSTVETIPAGSVFHYRLIYP